MGDAWIYSTGAATDDLVRVLAELGFSPRWVHSSSGVTTVGRPPALAVLVAGREDPAPDALFAELTNRRELADVPLLLAIEPEHLRKMSDVVHAHELLVPPYSVAELRVRVARATRGNGLDDAQGADSEDLISVGSLALNLTTYEVTIDGEIVGFTYMEHELLKFLMRHPRRVFSREALLTSVWGYAFYGSGRTVDVHVRRLRAKLGPGHAGRIKTVRNVGYLFDATRRPPSVPDDIARVAV